METTIFLRPAVAGLLDKGFVEARHHVDTRSTLTEAQFAANRELQGRLATSRGMPWYVIVDPNSGKVLRQTGLQGAFTEWEPFFIAFLKGEKGNG